MPLSSNLLLCAFCPSIKNKLREKYDHERDQFRVDALAAVRSGQITFPQMKNLLASFREAEKDILQLEQAISAGTPVLSSNENMDFYNSLQTGGAFRYLVCQRSDFELAKRHNKEFPDSFKSRFSF